MRLVLLVSNFFLPHQTRVLIHMSGRIMNTFGKLAYLNTNIKKINKT
jgi:hypothetical protein